MLDVKYLCQLTAERRQPTILKAPRYIGSYKHLKGELTLNLLFELSYGDYRIVERVKIFKVAWEVKYD